MKKMLSSINAIAVSSALLLTGCSQASVDMDKIQNITNNCNTIYENVSTVSADEIVENAQTTVEVANDFGEWYQEEIVEELLPTAEATAVAVAEAENSDDDAIFNEDINIFDILDEEAVAEIIVEPVIAQIDAYTEDAELMIEAADKKKVDGLELIRKGIELLSNVAMTKTEIDEEAISDMIDGLTLLVQGSNEVTDGANIIIQESARTANEIVAQAELLGVTGEEMDALKDTLKQAQDIRLYVFSDDVVEQLESAKDIITEYSDMIASGEEIQVDVDVAVDMDQIEAHLDAIPSYVEAVKNMVSAANNAAKYSQTLYKDIDASSQIVVDTARNIFEGENLEIAESAIKSYELVGDYLEAIPTKQIDEMEKQMEEVVKISKTINYKAILSGFFK